MSYTCSGCGEKFTTLSRKRLHECPEGAQFGGDAPDEEHYLPDADADELAETAVEGILECDECGDQSDAAESVEHTTADDGIAIVVEFTCASCSARNENSVVLEP